MPDIMQDKYILGQSQSGTVGSIGEEIRLDLQLEPNTNNLTGGNVSGIVTNPTGDPIVDALVKIMDSNYTPLMHDITDADGKYSFTNIPPNQTYNIFATATGMTLNQGNQFTVSNYQDLTINFTLTPDSAMELGVIAGDLLDQSSNNPISGAVVSLYLINADNTQTIQAITYTNQYGQYTFREIPQGNYSVEISALGYNSTSANVSITQPGQLVPMNVTMVQNPNTSRGTVSGIITDNSNQPIDRADVILYKVNSDNSLTPVSFTKTTASGIYLFANVEPGSYKVKSNQAEIVNVDVPSPVDYAPDFSGFDLFYTENYYIGKYIASEGTLENGAALDSGTGYVTGIGGATDGSVTLNVTSESSGTYYMAIQYLSSGNTILSISVNGSTVPINIIVGNAPSGSVRYIPINLNPGANTIKLYNKFLQTAPDIKEVAILGYIHSSLYQIANATLEGSASVLPSGFVTGLGGANNGGATITINVPINGDYRIEIPFINGGGTNMPLKVSVDGGAAVTGTFQPTPSTDPIDAISSRFSLGILNAGSHTIRFYNDTGIDGPILGNITVKLIVALANIIANTGTLANGALIDTTTQYVSNLGGTNNGEVTLALNVSQGGLYSLGIQYINGTNMSSNMKISINGAAGENYVFPKTDTSNASDAKMYYLNVSLVTGANTIKLYNDTGEANQSPWVNNVYLQQIIVNRAYTVTDSNITLENGATVQNGVITNIGTDLGSVTLLYPNLPLSGKYAFVLNYVTTSSTTVCSVDVNGTSTGTEYSFTPTSSTNVVDAERKVIILNLPAGNNTIRVHTN